MLSPVSLTIGAVLIHFFVNNMDTFPFCPWYVGGPVCSVAVSPVTVSPIVDTENVKIGKVIESESIHRMKIYTGLDKETKDEPLVGLNWQPCSSRDNVRVDASPVIGSFWQAVRAVTNIKADKFDILNLVIDDSRIAEFDDMFDFSQVSLHYIYFYFYWPIKLCILIILCFTTVTADSKSQRQDCRT